MVVSRPARVELVFGELLCSGWIHFVTSFALGWTVARCSFSAATAIEATGTARRAVRRWRGPSRRERPTGAISKAATDGWITHDGKPNTV